MSSAVDTIRPDCESPDARSSDRTHEANRLAGRVTSRSLSRAARHIPRIAEREQGLRQLDAEALHKTSLSLQYRAKSGETREQLLDEAFALVREAARRTLGMRHYDVQLLGGIVMQQRAIAEMQTGEGKTLTATLPTYLAAIYGRGAHVATANDYLASRDAMTMRPLFESLGLSVGVVTAEMSPQQRHGAYQCDVTYGTAKEFGFDFLRDRLTQRHHASAGHDFLGQMLELTGDSSAGQQLQRPPYSVLVDEADSLLIDEARTPLVISAVPEVDAEVLAAYRWAAEVESQFDVADHFQVDPESRSVELTSEGRRLVRSLPHPETINGVSMLSIYNHIELAIRVARDYQLDRHYVLRDGEIVIVDEFTGRLSEGRKWQAGIHQAIEAKEGVEVTAAASQAARITIQDYFLRYEHLAGMTGTARSSAGELRRIFQLDVNTIPTNRPVARQELATEVYAHAEAKWAAIVAEIGAMHAQGRPVLIGNRSIDKSEHLSGLLHEVGIEHQVLNAHRIAEEASVIAEAGGRGKVTVATNMAGRGTDIMLGEGVAELGGLHVICTELHESARIDRQLIGRCGRQGDPGTFRQYMAMDDDILQAGLGDRRAAQLARRAGTGFDPLRGYEPLLRRAQRRVERRHFVSRKMLMYHEKQRKKIQKQMGQDPYLDTPG